MSLHQSTRPPISRHCTRGTLPAVFALVCALGIPALPSINAAPPGYDAARNFAHALQVDYAQRGVPALTDRFDSESTRRRVLAPLGREALNDASAKTAWNGVFWPVVLKEMENLAKFPTLLIEQPSLIDGERVINALFLDDQGSLFTLSLWLEESAGKIVVVDHRSLIQTLPTSRRFRHILLLQGAPFTTALDDEERVLCFASMDNRRWTRGAFAAIGNGRLDLAHESWNRMTDDVKGTTVWREFRDIWASIGSAPAWEQWLKEHLAGRGANPLLALTYERAQTDKSKALIAIDQLIARTMNSPFLRTVKAEILLECGRPEEAWAIAREVYRRNPFAVHACPVAINAALATGRRDEAMAALEHWGRIVPAAQIEEFLARDTRTADFRSSEAYLGWRAAQPPPVTAPSTE